MHVDINDHGDSRGDHSRSHDLESDVFSIVSNRDRDSHPKDASGELWEEIPGPDGLLTYEQLRESLLCFFQDYR